MNQIEKRLRALEARTKGRTPKRNPAAAFLADCLMASGDKSLLDAITDTTRFPTLHSFLDQANSLNRGKDWLVRLNEAAGWPETSSKEGYGTLSIPSDY